MYKDLLRELSCCPDAEYGCSRCKHKDSLHCRETLMRESADAIEKLKEELADKPKWISVKERLPEYGDYVLGIGPKHGYYICEYRGLVGIPAKKSPWFTAQGKSVKATHWMPLPEPPKEGGGEDGI